MKKYAFKRRGSIRCSDKNCCRAGGTEAQDWADMLFRMYQRYCERQGYKSELTNYQMAMRQVSKPLRCKRKAIWHTVFKSENGVHRLVRVSPFNAQGRG